MERLRPAALGRWQGGCWAVPRCRVRANPQPHGGSAQTAPGRTTGEGDSATLKSSGKTPRAPALSRDHFACVSSPIGLSLAKPVPSHPIGGPPSPSMGGSSGPLGGRTHGPRDGDLCADAARDIDLASIAFVKRCGPVDFGCEPGKVENLVPGACATVVVASPTNANRRRIIGVGLPRANSSGPSRRVKSHNSSTSSSRRAEGVRSRHRTNPT